jgi:hypothetical protein
MLSLPQQSIQSRRGWVLSTRQDDWGSRVGVHRSPPEHAPLKHRGVQGEIGRGAGARERCISPFERAPAVRVSFVAEALPLPCGTSGFAPRVAPAAIQNRRLTSAATFRIGGQGRPPPRRSFVVDAFFAAKPGNGSGSFVCGSSVLLPLRALCGLKLIPPSICSGYAVQHSESIRDPFA